MPLRTFLAAVPRRRPPPRRAELAPSPELMDGALPYPEAHRALSDLDRVNRLLFGVAAARRALAPRLLASAAAGRPATLLDLGTGSGRLIRSVARAAERGGFRVWVVGLDRRLAHLVVGRSLAGGEADHRHVAASVEALPFRDGAFDWTVSNLVFHHFGGLTNRAVLEEMRRCARRGAAVVDLRRSRLAVWLVRGLFPLLGIGRIARHDGVLSLRQSWSLREVRELVADLPVEELRRRFPFRWSLVVKGR
jgi:ubiquinone/menaquinone biosynthesis C-methylase UbiE